MKLVIFSTILNNHQANIADELYRLIVHSFKFVELRELSGDNKKGDIRDYTNCPYLIRAWLNKENYTYALHLARESECCVFSGIESLPFQKERMKLGKLSFDMSERWLKRGIINIFSLNIFQQLIAYHLLGWKRKPIYKLCCSAFAAEDHKKLGMYNDRCFKWGYFTAVDSTYSLQDSLDSNTKLPLSILWCARFIKIKHPELPIYLAKKLKDNGLKFRLTMIGEGYLKKRLLALADYLKVSDEVVFLKNMPNDEVLNIMKENQVFILSSDKSEGWGAVSNESMASGCALIASKCSGAAQYLIKDGKNGYLFDSPSVFSDINCIDNSSLEDLYGKVKSLILDSELLYKMRQQALYEMRNVWSPKVAASRLLTLVDNLLLGQNTPYSSGPCSKA